MVKFRNKKSSTSIILPTLPVEYLHTLSKRCLYTMSTFNSSSQNNATNNDGTTGVPRSARVREQGINQRATSAADDEERRRLRRERNREAATRCRERRREKTANLVQETEEFENKNDDLRKDIEVLESQKKKLEDILTTHLTVCTNETLNRPRAINDETRGDTGTS